jgi:hypothetical protein
VAISSFQVAEKEVPIFFFDSKRHGRHKRIETTIAKVPSCESTSLNADLLIGLIV